MLENIIKATQVSPLSDYNYGKLMCTGKPKRVSGEKRFYELNVGDYTLQQQALSLVLNHKKILVAKR